MGRAPNGSCSFSSGSSHHRKNEAMNKGAWTAEEDKLLVDQINANGEGKWGRIAKQAGLKRCGKSCRLRWLNYLRPDIKRGNISLDEEDLIIRLHRLLGNRWSLIAGRLPGRTDNEIKNYWNSTLRKRLQQAQQQQEQPNSNDKSEEYKKTEHTNPPNKTSSCYTNNDTAEITRKLQPTDPSGVPPSCRPSKLPNKTTRMLTNNKVVFPTLDLQTCSTVVAIYNEEEEEQINMGRYMGGNPPAASIPAWSSLNNDGLLINNHEGRQHDDDGGGAYDQWLSTEDESFSSGCTDHRHSFGEYCIQKLQAGGNDMLPDSDFWDVLGDWMGTAADHDHHRASSSKLAT